MSVTYGFYNSVKGDRKYDAIQMSSIFDGIIRDGILQHFGTAMMVKESEGMIINVGIGRAWFNHTWTLNDALLPLAVPISEVILNRIDAVVLEVDSRESVRANAIKIIKGTPASSPKNPTMVKTNDRWQYPLAYIRVNAGVTSIRQANITNCIGTAACPFVTAPLEKMSIDALVAQWGDQWNQWFIGVKDALENVENGNLLSKVIRLYEELYKKATESDIDEIIYGSYIDEDKDESLDIFEIGTNEDIDNIISNTYIDGTDDAEDATEERIKGIVNKAFDE